MGYHWIFFVLAVGALIPPGPTPNFGWLESNPNPPNLGGPIPNFGGPNPIFGGPDINVGGPDVNEEGFFNVVNVGGPVCVEFIYGFSSFTSNN